MRRVVSSFVVLLFTLAAAGCSDMAGLRVLTGEADQETLTDRTVEALDLVMADKSGMTDPAIVAAADRIEAATSGSVDIIEIRNNAETRIFTVDMMFNPPQSDGSVQGQIAQLDALRRAIELTWQGTMRESEGSDLLRVILMAPQDIVTLDNGVSFIGVVLADAQIERGAAAGYLSGTRSLNGFFDLIAQGTLSYEQPEQMILYEGQPNHSMFMLGAAQ
ncbi:MAG: hypothetical protein SGI73_22625 [Chloroflexota bacterium]|nr:hypothetical protein [Chloroflexota bacterium]